MAKTIITIGREYCTGGNYIAEDVANTLGIKLAAAPAACAVL